DVNDTALGQNAGTGRATASFERDEFHVYPPLTSSPVAWMERSVIRVTTPDFASLHPGYEQPQRTPSIPRRGRHHHKIADADRLRQLEAEQDDLGNTFRRDEFRIVQHFAVVFERDPHGLVNVGLHQAWGDVDHPYVVLGFRLLQRFRE